MCLKQLVKQEMQIAIASYGSRIERLVVAVAVAVAAVGIDAR